MKNYFKFLKIVSYFQFDGEITDIKQYGNGLINQTFLITTTEAKYIFQKINTVAFTNIEALMNNINVVTNHLKNKGTTTLEVVNTFEDSLFYVDYNAFYRMYKYVENSVCYEKVTDLKIIEKAGSAFGELHNLLADIDINEIAEIIPNFHNTPKRVSNLEKAISNQLNEKRSLSCQEEIRFLLSYKKELGLIMKGLRDGSIPKRITHNDPKINNILFDVNTNEVKCVIDLDTVMPGSILFDIGDALRSLFTGDNEDNEDTSLLKVNLEVYEAYIRGYCSKMGDKLTPKEKELLPYSPFILTMEVAVRFVEDYIRGDVYFSVSKPQHNLIRARTQIALAKDIILHLEELKTITNNILKDY